MAAQVALRRQQAQEENEARELSLIYGCHDPIMAMHRAGLTISAAMTSMMQNAGVKKNAKSDSCKETEEMTTSSELDASENSNSGSSSPAQDSSNPVDLKISPRNDSPCKRTLDCKAAKRRKTDSDSPVALQGKSPIERKRVACELSVHESSLELLKKLFPKKPNNYLRIMLNATNGDMITTLQRLVSEDSVSEAASTPSVTPTVNVISPQRHATTAMEQQQPRSPVMRSPSALSTASLLKGTLASTDRTTYDSTTTPPPMMDPMNSLLKNLPLASAQSGPLSVSQLPPAMSAYFPLANVPLMPSFSRSLAYLCPFLQTSNGVSMAGAPVAASSHVMSGATARHPSENAVLLPQPQLANAFTSAQTPSPQLLGAAGSFENSFTHLLARAASTSGRATSTSSSSTSPVGGQATTGQTSPRASPSICSPVSQRDLMEDYIVP